MSFVRRTESNEPLVVAENTKFRFTQDISIIERDVDTNNDAKIILGSDEGVNNISLKYPGNLGGGGLYVNEPEVPILEVDNAGNVLIPSIIIEDVVFEDIETNIIKTKDTGKVVHESDTIFDDVKVKISQIGGDITSVCQLHLQSFDSTCIFLEADINNIDETDKSFLLMSQDANLTAMRMGSKGNITDNDYVIQWGSVSSSDLQFIHNSSITSNGTGIEPTFAGTETLIMEMRADEVDTFVNLNLNANDITNCGEVQCSGISASSGLIGVSDNISMTNNDILDVGLFTFQTEPALANTETKILAINADDEIVYRDISTFPGGNPFDQSLNTTDSVTFLDTTSTNFNLTNVNAQRSNYIINSLAVSANTDTTLTNWTPVVTSTRVNVDPVTGIFSPVAGLYSLSYQAVILSNAGLTEIGARLVDDLGNTTWLSVVRTSDLFEPETGWQGAQFENLVGYFDGTRTYTIHCKIDAAETMAFQVELSRLL